MLTVLHRIDPDENMDRYYIVTIQATLFDPIAVVCQYGSRHTAWQQTRVIPVADAAEAEELAASIVKTKVGRGYVVVERRDAATMTHDIFGKKKVGACQPAFIPLPS